MSDNTTYTLETVYNLHDDETGECISVGPDADGLDGIEIVYIHSDGKRSNHFFLTIEQAKHVAQMLLKATEGK
jgi:hypothetical protein